MMRGYAGMVNKAMISARGGESSPMVIAFVRDLWASPTTTASWHPGVRITENVFLLTHEENS